MVEPDVLRSIAQKFGKGSLAMCPQDDRELKALGYAIAVFCCRRWDELLQHAAAGAWPILYCHGSDGWSRTVSELRTIRTEDHLITRHGKLRAEFNLEREWLKCIDRNGRIHGAMTFTPPRPMLFGKSGWHIFQAAVETRDLLRTSVADSIIMSWYVQDGLHSDQFGRRQAGRHSLFYDMLYDDMGSDPLAAQKDIVWSWRCTLHVARCAIHWAMTFARPLPTTLDDIHTAIKSLQNSSLVILELVDTFARAYARFVQPPQESDGEVWMLWRLLGVPDNMIKLVVRMNPHWNARNRTLELAVDQANDPQRYANLTSLLMFSFDGRISRRHDGLELCGVRKRLWRRYC